MLPAEHITAHGAAYHNIDIQRQYGFISERELTSTFAICRGPSVCLSVVCRLSVTLVNPILRRLKFSAMFLRFLVRWPSGDIPIKFYGDRPRGTPPSGQLNTKGVAE